MPAEKKWPAFDAKTWLQAQIMCIVQAELATPLEARAAIESIADDDRFWATIGPVIQGAIEALQNDPKLRSIEAEHDARERNRRGLA